MGFKLACISGRASLIDDNNYYDLEAISQGEFDEDTSNALLNIEGLNKLSANLEKFEPSGLIEEKNIDSPISSPKNCYAVGLNYQIMQKKPIWTYLPFL